jgi:hypothetical protein
LFLAQSADAGLFSQRWAQALVGSMAGIGGANGPLGTMVGHLQSALVITTV